GGDLQSDGGQHVSSVSAAPSARNGQRRKILASARWGVKPLVAAQHRDFGPSALDVRDTQ
ncbi:MAG: hypothetical protein KJ011_16040, partial [Burkholderiaceae bacterium]|nr:hypothetical protein [Burkholderiaceae bacterium]